MLSGLCQAPPCQLIYVSEDSEVPCMELQEGTNKLSCPCRLQCVAVHSGAEVVRQPCCLCGKLQQSCALKRQPIEREREREILSLPGGGLVDTKVAGLCSQVLGLRSQTSHYMRKGLDISSIGYGPRLRDLGYRRVADPGDGLMFLDNLYIHQPFGACTRFRLFCFLSCLQYRFQA